MHHCAANSPHSNFHQKYCQDDQHNPSERQKLKPKFLVTSYWGSYLSISMHLVAKQYRPYQWRIQDLWKGGAGNLNKFPARPEKVAQWGGGGGGLRHIFPPEFLGPTFTLLGRGTVRLPDRPPGWQAKKKKKKKKPEKIKIVRKKGGPRPIRPPPWIRHCLPTIN